MPETVIERSTITSELLDAYAGKWIAVRDGEVVASAENLAELRENPAVRRDDAVYRVPERSTYFY
jgi:Family of unknown function (DUF5678)